MSVLQSANVHDRVFSLLKRMDAVSKQKWRHSRRNWYRDKLLAGKLK
jgi:hypothetical protein